MYAPAVVSPKSSGVSSAPKTRTAANLESSESSSPKSSKASRACGASVAIVEPAANAAR